MTDIALRFHKDMLVCASSLPSALKRQGIESERDFELLMMLEPDTLLSALRLEAAARPHCFVLPTGGLTPARLARAELGEKACDIAAAAFDAVYELSPQHILVEIGPCGLPLDPSLAYSLNENRAQYAQAARIIDSLGVSMDAFFLNGFATCDDIKCALMGVRQASDDMVFASVDVNADGTLASGRGKLEDAIAIMREYGAAVVGFSTAADLETTCSFAARARACCGNLPLLVQLKIVQPKGGAERMGTAQASAAQASTAQASAAQANAAQANTAQASAAQMDAAQVGAGRSGAAFLGTNQQKDAQDYAYPDAMANAALKLRAAGAQFVRAVGDATPAYTAVLVATLEGLDALAPKESDAQDASDKAGVCMAEVRADTNAETGTSVDVDEVAKRLRKQVSAALFKEPARG